MSMTAVGTAHSASRAIASMVLLAGLDLVGAALARHWATHRSLVALVGGVAVFGLLFVVYGKSLDYAHLTTITVGWFVLLQLGVMVLDAVHGEATLSWDRVTAMVAVLALQGYLTVTA